MKKQIASPILLATPTKLASALTLALLASAVMTAAAEEVVGTILSGPYIDHNRGISSKYYVDATDDLIEVQFRIFKWDKSDDANIYNTVRRYLRIGSQIIFENEGLRPFDFFGPERLIAITINGRRVEMNQLLTREEIAREFTYLDRKLRAQGL